jgi:hypothetical protein
LVGILYCKDTKSGIKIPGFHQNIKDFQNKKMSFAFKNSLKNVVDFSAFVLSKWINIWLYFYTARIQTQY